MPPQTRISKEDIIETAFALTRAQGFERVTARGLAAALHCSTQPVFHAFGSMEALKTAVYHRTRQFFEEQMLAPPADPQTPYFLSMGLRYVALAREEKNLFRLLCMSGCGPRLERLADLAKQLPLPMDPQVFVKTWLFAHGIAAIVATNPTDIAPKEIRALLMETCADFRQVPPEKRREAHRDKVLAAGENGEGGEGDGRKGQ